MTTSNTPGPGPASDSPEQVDPAAVLTTYRYLRLAPLPLLLILLVSVAIEAFRQDPVCLLGSISGYYYTPARGAFVGGLCAVGVCLIVYKGNDPLEDVLLNFSGFMAFVVAFVPTVPDDLCGPVTHGDEFVREAVRNGGWTLLIVTVVALGIRWFLAVRARRSCRTAEPDRGPVALRRWTRVASIGCVAVVLGELVLFVAAPGTFQDVSHDVAAVTMVLGVIAVMVANARGLARVSTGDAMPDVRTWTNRYAAVAAVMAVLLAVTIAAHVLEPRPRLVLTLEVVVIGNFMVFWAMQTAELWDYRARPATSGGQSG